MVNEKDILNALSTIIDPDFNKDIVSLGFVKDIRIKDNFVSFSIELTTPACPIKAEFQKAAESAVMTLDGVEQVAVNMTSKESRLSKNAGGMDKVKDIIAVASGKGGVGKSTVSANLANELAKRGYRVGLLDTDIFGPSIPSLFGIHNAKIYQKNGMLIPIEADNGLKLFSFGFVMGNGPAIMRGPMVSGYIQQILTQTDWGELDYLVLDLPPGTGDIQLTLTQSLQISGAVIVTTRQSLSIADVTKGIEMFEKVNVPMLGIVENMSYFICDSCDKKHYIFGDSNKTSLEEKYGLKTLAEIPLDSQFGKKIGEMSGNPHVENMVDRIVRSLGMNGSEKLERPEITLKDNTIELAWKDGRFYELPYRKLRLACPCASCVDEYSGEKLLKEEGVPVDIKATEAIPLGNYAVVIKWSDGHDSGIYSYSKLESLLD